MNLVFDVGNTETVLGLFEAGELQEHWRISTYPERTTDEMGLLVRALIRESGFDLELVTGAAIASVVPPITPIVLDTCQRHLGVPALNIDASSPLPIKLDVEEPLGVGADRIVNTLAAARLYRSDVIAVDLGTATTFDCITADGVFHGGVISPGVRSGADALVRRTAKLPRVDLEPPATVIGRRTETAVRSGIFFSEVDAIDGIVRRIKTEWKRPEALVVATGGFAQLIAPHCATVDKVEPFLTLIGLDLAHSYLSSAKSRLVPVRASGRRH